VLIYTPASLAEESAIRKSKKYGASPNNDQPASFTGPSLFPLNGERLRKQTWKSSLRPKSKTQKMITRSFQNGLFVTA
jgi:hypothetical protein